MPHICPDEILAFLAMAPWVGGVVMWAWSKWKAMRLRGRILPHNKNKETR